MTYLKTTGKRSRAPLRSDIQRGSRVEIIKGRRKGGRGVVVRVANHAWYCVALDGGEYAVLHTSYLIGENYDNF